MATTLKPAGRQGQEDRQAARTTIKTVRFLKRFYLTIFILNNFNFLLQTKATTTKKPVTTKPTTTKQPVTTKPTTTKTTVRSDQILHSSLFY